MYARGLIAQASASMCFFGLALCRVQERWSVGRDVPTFRRLRFPEEWQEFRKKPYVPYNESYKPNTALLEAQRVFGEVSGPLQRSWACVRGADLPPGEGRQRCQREPQRCTGWGLLSEPGRHKVLEFRIDPQEGFRGSWLEGFKLGTLFRVCEECLGTVAQFVFTQSVLCHQDARKSGSADRAATAFLPIFGSISPKTLNPEP